jgi:hypothetical protein
MTPVSGLASSFKYVKRRFVLTVIRAYLFILNKRYVQLFNVLLYWKNGSTVVTNTVMQGLFWKLIVAQLVKNLCFIWNKKIN